MADIWPTRSIADITTRVAMGPFGSNIKTDNFVEVGVPVIRGGNLTFGRFIGAEFVYLTEHKADELKNSNAFPDDIVFTHRGSLGQVGIVPREPYPRYVVSQSQMVVTCDVEQVEPLFLYYYFKSRDGQHSLLMNTSQTGVPAISRPVTSLKGIQLSIPPLAVQRDIVRILGGLDDKIELNRRMNETIESIARAIFKSWFVDFDPVRAKADGRKPAGMGAETAALFPDSFEESEMGKIPTGWSIKTIDSLAELNAWTLRKTDDLDTVEYIEISEVSRGTVADTQVFRRGTEPSRARRRVRHGDTVLSTVRPERGAFFLTLRPSPNLVVSTGFAVVSPTGAPWSLVYAALTQPAVSEHLGQLADGGAYPAVDPTVIGRWEIAWPSKPGIPEAYQNLCGPLYELADYNRRESSNLANIRDALLPKLISGEIRVKDTERFVEEHAG